MSGGASWRSPSTADRYRDHDYADFAQEFLQRNPDYVADYEKTEARTKADPANRIAEREGLAGRWGLCFPHIAQRRCPAQPGAVVATPRARRRHPRNAA